MSHQTDTVVSTELELTITRCGCSDEAKRDPLWHAAHGIECPRPLAIEPRGVVAAHYANPLVQRAWEHMRRALGFIPGTARTIPKE